MYRGNPNGVETLRHARTVYTAWIKRRRGEGREDGEVVVSECQTLMNCLVPHRIGRTHNNNNSYSIKPL
jgi:hypothetical protein